MGVLVDSNVLLDVFTDDPTWGSWSSERLARVLDAEPVVIDPIVYAEVSVGFSEIELLDELLPAPLFTRESLPYPAGFLAVKAFVAYRRNGGQHPTPLPNFYIGAHALVSGHVLLTRDRRGYETYFPKLPLIAP